MNPLLSVNIVIIKTRESYNVSPNLQNVLFCGPFMQSACSNSFLQDMFFLLGICLNKTQYMLNTQSNHYNYIQL